MIKLAIIGTSWISAQFIDAAITSGEFILTGVFSRHQQSASDFIESLSVPSSQVNVFTSLTDLADSDEVDAVYIASPNSLHAPQAMQMLQAKKHVICEKPLASNYALAQQMFNIAKQNDVVLFEAFMTPYLPNFDVLKQQIKQIGTLRKALISYCQYSSRYPKFLNGENPNTFNPQFSNGSIMDIGYYCIGATIELFGEPEKIAASAELLTSGVDGHGSVILSYAGFDVTVLHSKVSDSLIPCEIQGEEASLQIEMISTCNKVMKLKRGETPQDVSVQQQDNRMIYEAQEFTKQVHSNTMNDSAIQRSLIVAKVLTQIRQQTNVVFPTDEIV